MKYYTPTKINKYKATYNMVIGERSNGKTYALLLQCLESFIETGGQFGYVRRWKEDVIGRRASLLFAGINSNGEVSRLTDGEYMGVHYWAGKFYLCTYGDNGKPIYSDEDVIGYTFALSDSEHDKSTSFPLITTIVFDEFITNKVYLNDEFVLFMNVVSTIVRRRENVRIYMLGNTVNRFCPYFTEMGLTHVPKMEQGSIDLYRYGESTLTVAVEYCATIDIEGQEVSKRYFAFSNPKLEMITSGSWELALYPHLPHKYRPKDVLLRYFIEFNEQVYQCEIIEVEDVVFTYIHVKTTEYQNSNNDIIYSLDYTPRPNYNRNIFRPVNKIQTKIAWFFKHDKVFYQNNEVGDAINNYLKALR